MGGFLVGIEGSKPREICEEDVDWDDDRVDLQGLSASLKALSDMEMGTVKICGVMMQISVHVYFKRRFSVAVFSKFQVQTAILYILFSYICI